MSRPKFDPRLAQTFMKTIFSLFPNLIYNIRGADRAVAKALRVEFTRDRILPKTLSEKFSSLSKMQDASLNPEGGNVKPACEKFPQQNYN